MNRNEQQRTGRLICKKEESITWYKHQAEGKKGEILHILGRHLAVHFIEALLSGVKWPVNRYSIHSTPDDSCCMKVNKAQTLNPLILQTEHMCNPASVHHCMWHCIIDVKQYISTFCCHWLHMYYYLLVKKTCSIYHKQLINVIHMTIY